MYFYDDAAGDSDWACRCAASLRRPEVPATVKDEEREQLIAKATNEEILQMLQITEDEPGMMNGSPRH